MVKPGCYFVSRAQEQERELERAAAQALEAGAAAEAQHGEEAARLAAERERLQNDAAEVLGSKAVTTDMLNVRLGQSSNLSWKCLCCLCLRHGPAACCSPSLLHL